MMITLLELCLCPTLRWRSDFDAIAPIFFVESLPGMSERVNRKILPIFTEQLKALASGVKMFCEPLKKDITVFAFVSQIVGDHPGRAAISKSLKTLIIFSFIIYSGSKIEYGQIPVSILYLKKH